MTENSSGERRLDDVKEKEQQVQNKIRIDAKNRPPPTQKNTIWFNPQQDKNVGTILRNF